MGLGVSLHQLDQGHLLGQDAFEGKASGGKHTHIFLHLPFFHSGRHHGHLCFFPFFRLRAGGTAHGIIAVILVGFSPDKVAELIGQIEQQLAFQHPGHGHQAADHLTAGQDQSGLSFGQAQLFFGLFQKGRKGMGHGDLIFFHQVFRQKHLMIFPLIPFGHRNFQTVVAQVKSNFSSVSH